MTFSIMTFSIMTLNIMTFSITTFSRMTFSIMKYTITTFSIKTLTTPSKNDTQHNNTLPLCWMSLSWVWHLIFTILNAIKLIVVMQTSTVSKCDKHRKCQCDKKVSHCMWQISEATCDKHTIISRDILLYCVSPLYWSQISIEIGLEQALFFLHLNM